MTGAESIAGLPGPFDIDERLKRLSDIGDQLLAFAGAVDFEIFRADLDRALGYSDGLQGGRPPFEPVLMFKIRVIQAANNLSDERAEFLVNDPRSFMRFLGLGLSDCVPEARTIWLFREKLTSRGDQGIVRSVRRLSAHFGLYRDVRADRRRQPDLGAQAAQHTAREVRHQGRRHSREWAKNPAKLADKARGARWTVKFTKAKERTDGTTPPVDIAIPAFGYKNHVSIDKEFGLIRTWLATDAAANDGARLREGLLDRTNTASAGRADTGYRSQANEDFMAKSGFVSKDPTKSPRAVRCPTSSAAPTR